MRSAEKRPWAAWPAVSVAAIVTVGVFVVGCVLAARVRVFDTLVKEAAEEQERASALARRVRGIVHVDPQYARELSHLQHGFDYVSGGSDLGGFMLGLGDHDFSPDAAYKLHIVYADPLEANNTYHNPCRGRESQGLGCFHVAPTLCLYARDGLPTGLNLRDSALGALSAWTGANGNTTLTVGDLVEGHSAPDTAVHAAPGILPWVNEDHDSKFSVGMERADLPAFFVDSSYEVHRAVAGGKWVRRSAFPENGCAPSRAAGMNLPAMRLAPDAPVAPTPGDELTFGFDWFAFLQHTNFTALCLASGSHYCMHSFHHVN